MAYFHTNVLDNQIKALPTIDTASGSVASFDTDMTENLIEVICQIVAQQASGTPTPDNPLPITTYTSLNLSHSGADTSNPNVTNIPFGQTVAKGTLNVTTGVLEITWSIIDLGSLTWTYDSVYDRFFSNTFNMTGLPTTRTMKCLCSCYKTISDGRPLAQVPNNSIYNGGGSKALYVHDNRFTVGTDLKTAVSGQYCTYQLETPITIQLDSITLQALLNENNIWCDTNGDTEVKFILSVGKKIA